jgi:hypothetical protein
MKLRDSQNEHRRRSNQELLSETGEAELDDETVHLIQQLRRADEAKVETENDSAR